MAHLVETMAYVGQTPWHGLGNQLGKRQSIDVWAKQAGMNWEILEAPVRFVTSKSNNPFGEILGDASKVIFPTGVVSWKKNKAGSRRFLVHV